jgi:quercetin dioxygenase-like cupin family protein
MQIQNVPFCVTQWDQVSPTKHKGETGTSLWHTLEVGNIRVRIVEYKPGYLADHWCSRGHVLLVLEGELVVELQDGQKYSLPIGTSFQVADNQEPHRVYTGTGAKVFIVD